jgi:hypothetical protein
VVVALTVAVLVTDAATLFGAWNVKLRMTLAPAGKRADGARVTVPALAVQPSALDTKVKPAGSGSVAVTPAACDGPAFATVNE